LPAQYVKPYVKTNKNDYIDAEACSEAVTRPTMRFVPIKSDDQLDLQSLHRVRERWVVRRTAVINQSLYPASWKTPTTSCPAHSAYF
jgi:transposase